MSGTGQHSSEVITRSHSPRRVARAVVAGVAAAVLGVVIGGITGANIGGNWFTSFTAFGERGYQATAPLGAVAGAVLFGALGAWLGWRPRPTHRRG